MRADATAVADAILDVYTPDWRINETQPVIDAGRRDILRGFAAGLRLLAAGSAPAASFELTATADELDPDLADACPGHEPTVERHHQHRATVARCHRCGALGPAVRWPTAVQPPGDDTAAINAFRDRYHHAD